MPSSVRAAAGAGRQDRSSRVERLARAILERAAPYLVARIAPGPADHPEAAAQAYSALILAYLSTLPRAGAGTGAMSRAELRAAAITRLRQTRPGEAVPCIHGNAPRPNGFATGYPGWTLLLLGDAVPADVAAHVRRGVERGADWYLDFRPPTGLFYDTKAEETAWDVTTLAAAAALFPRHRHRAAWQAKAREMVLNGYSREADRFDTRTRFDGKRLSDLVCTANVAPDFTVQNHEGFGTCYQVCNNTLAAAYAIYGRWLGGVPDWLTWNWAGLHGVTKRLVLRDGQLAWPAGNDYWPFTHVGFAHYHALMADALGCGVALWCLERVLAHAAAEQAGNGDGSLFGRRVPGIPAGWEANLTHFALFAHLFAPYRRAPELTDAGVAAAVAGPFASEYVDTVLVNGPRLFASFSWCPVYAKGQAFGAVTVSADSALTEAWVCLPNLVGTVRLRPGAERAVVFPPLGPGEFEHGRVRLSDALELLGQHRAHVQGSADGVAWSLGQLLDPGGEVLHTVGMLAAADAVIHVERFTRYGQKCGVAGVETLNYRLLNDAVDRAGIHVAWRGGAARVAPGAQWRCDEPGDVVVFDRRLGVVRVLGGAALRLAQAQPAEPRHGLAKTRPWRLRLWGDAPAVEPAGHGVLAEQVTLFVPAARVAAAAAAGRGVTARISPLGELDLTVELPGWRGRYRLGLGQKLEFRPV